MNTLATPAAADEAVVAEEAVGLAPVALVVGESSVDAVVGAAVEAAVAGRVVLAVTRCLALGFFLLAASALCPTKDVVKAALISATAVTARRARRSSACVIDLMPVG